MSPVQKCCTLPPHEEATLPSWLPSPLPLPLLSLTPTLSPSLLPLPSPLPMLLPSPLQSPIAIAAAMGHCCSCHEPLPPPSLSRHHQPLLSPLPLLLDIAVSFTVGHCSCHRRQASPLPCRWPFLRVVALVRQELYSTNQSKECLPYFILLGQWGAY